MTSRSCEGCTKCCEGSVSGTVNGVSFYPGKPCHFVLLGKGCSIYEDRPETPCKSYSCAWRTDLRIPEWMKPSEVNCLITYFEEDGFSWISLLEAGSAIDVRVLSWLVQFSLENRYNLEWQMSSGRHWIGDQAFCEYMSKKAIS